jgi:hypothetical protein
VYIKKLNAIHDTEKSGKNDPVIKKIGRNINRIDGISKKKSFLKFINLISVLF